MVFLRRILSVVSLFILLFASPLAAESPAISSFCIPYIGKDIPGIVSGIQFTDNDMTDAALCSFIDPANPEDGYTFAAVHATPGIFRFTLLYFGFPSFQYDSFSIKKIAIPLLSAGIELRKDQWLCKCSVINGFPPYITTTLEGQQFSVKPDSVLTGTALIGFSDWAVSVFYTTLGSSFYLENVDLGDASGSIFGTAVTWKEFGAFYAAARGNLSASAYSLFSIVTGIAGGSANIQGFGGWGNFSLKHNTFSAELWTVCGVFFSDDTELTASYSYQDSGSTNSDSWAFSANWNPSFALIAHPALKWRPVRNLEIGIARWIPCIYGWEIQNRANPDGEESENSQASFTQDFLTAMQSLDLRTVLFSGLELSISWSL